VYCIVTKRVHFFNIDPDDIFKDEIYDDALGFGNDSDDNFD